MSAMRYWEETISLTLSWRKVNSQFLVTGPNWLPGLYTLLYILWVADTQKWSPPHLLPSLPGPMACPEAPPHPQHTRMQEGSSNPAGEEELEWPYFGGRSESSQKRKLWNLEQSEKASKWRGCSFTWASKGGSYECNGRTPMWNKQQELRQEERGAEIVRLAEL